MMSIAVVVPLFNKRAFVLSTVRALASQLGPRDELIIVDDCSTDDGPAIVESLSLDRVRVIRMGVNSGPASARNHGARQTTGEYVLFFDADDIPHPRLLSHLRQCIARHPGECVFAYELAFEAHGESMAFDDAEVAAPTPTKVLDQDEFVRSCLRGKPLCTASSTCVRIKEFLLAGGFQPGLRYCEDPELWSRLSADHRIVHIGRALAVYRDVPMSQSYGLRAQPGSVHPYVKTLLGLSRQPGDPYQRLARSLITKNTVFSVSMGGSRSAIVAYLRSVRPALTALHFAGLRVLALAPRALLRMPLALRARLARMKLQTHSVDH